MILTFDNISLYIDTKKLFTDINLTILPSSIIYVKGSNGSGKSSLLRILGGLQTPTFGQIKINNMNIDNIKKPFATYIGHELGIKLELKVWDNLIFFATLYNSYAALEATIHYFDLHDILEEKVYNLSSGNKKKIAMAKLLMSNSPLWLLDEVDSNLDEANKKLLHNLIVSKSNSGGIIFIASHDKVFTTKPQIFEIQNYV